MYSSASVFTFLSNAGTMIFGLLSDPRMFCAYAIGLIVMRCAYLPNYSGGANCIARWYASTKLLIASWGLDIISRTGSLIRAGIVLLPEVCRGRRFLDTRNNGVMFGSPVFLWLGATNGTALN